MDEAIECDLLINGAGMAGCIATMSLYRDFKIVLLEKGASNSDYLTETLIASSRRIFRELDIESWLETDSCRQTYRISDGTVSYWTDNQPVYTDALRNPEGGNFVIRKNDFLAELRNLTSHLPFPFMKGVIQSLQRDGNHWEIAVQLNDGAQRIYKAKKIIDASGRTAVLPRKLGINRMILDKLICISAIVETSSPNLMCQSFADKNGWWFFCPLNQNRLQISYYTDADLIDKNFTKAEAFKAFLNENHAWKHLFSTKSFANVTFIGTHAASTSRLSEFSGPGWVAIGDSAMCFDPLSSQGSYKAMATAMQLSHLLKTFVTAGETAEQDTFFREQFNAQMERIWGHYLQHHSYYYGMANRDSAFWNRRIVANPESEKSY